MNRPLLWVATSYAIGIALAARYAVPAPFLIIAALSALVLSLIPYRLRKRTAVNVLLMVAICLAGGLHYTVRRPVVKDDPLSRELNKRYGEWVTIEGEVRQTSLFHEDIESISFVIEVQKIGDEESKQAISGRAHVGWQLPDLDLRLGDVIKFSARVGRFPGHLNPGLTHFRDFLHRQRIHSALSVYGPGKVEKVGFTRPRRSPYLVEIARRKMHQTFRSTMPEKHADFLSAVWLGERNMLRDDMKRRFVESGTYHFTVVSGLHVFIVYSMIALILGISLGARKKRLIIAIAFVVFYALISAARPPVVRAAIMAVIILSAGLFRREPDRLNTLCLACLLILLWDPALLFRASFQLSFLAATAVVMFAPMVEEFFLRAIARRRQLPMSSVSTGFPPLAPLPGFSRLPYVLIRAFSYTLALAVFMAPMTARTFHIFVPVGVIANVCLIPLIAPVLSLAALGSLCGFFSINVARLFTAADRIVIELVFRLADFFSSIPGGHFYVRSPSTVSIVCFYTAMALVLFHRHIRVRRSGLVSVITCLFLTSIVAYAFVIRPPQLEVVFLDVGQGDCIFVQLPDGGAMLIDGGPTGRRDIGRNTIVPFLLDRGVRRLDAVMLTHPEADHIGGLIYVLENFPVKLLLTNGERKDTDTYREFAAKVDRREIPTDALREGSRVEAGKVRIRTLHPPRRPEDRIGMDVNERSLVMQMTYGTVDFLLTGDISDEIERDLCARYDDLESEVIKVPHHGSRYSSSNEFITAVKPEVAVVSVGRNNWHGHPAPEVIERYRSADCTIFRTDTDGAVTITSDGKEYWYRTEADTLPQDLSAERRFLELWEAL
jgi:competence protein ComEC